MGKKIWVRPVIGMLIETLGGDRRKEEEYSGYIPVGPIKIGLGVLSGLSIGFFETVGPYFGVLGAVAIIPFLAHGIIGIPIGIHIKKKFGFGVLVPLYVGDWWVGLISALVCFVLGVIGSERLE